MSILKNMKDKFTKMSTMDKVWTIAWGTVFFLVDWLLTWGVAWIATSYVVSRIWKKKDLFSRDNWKF